MSTLEPLVLSSAPRSRHLPLWPTSGVVGTPALEGETVQTNEVVAVAPLPSFAVTSTVVVPALVGLPVIVPEAEMLRPAGSPVALNVGDWPLVESLAVTGTETVAPAM